MRGLRPLALAVLVAGTGCSDDAGDGAASPASSSVAATTTTAFAVGDPALREELLEMMDEDQRERSGESTASGDQQRTERLRSIIDDHGWPTFALVGTDGATAAWLIAQHSDHDVAFQQQVLDLMRPLVGAGQADASELAYLEDRVAVNTGAPQTYGTQIRCADGVPVPATPIADEADVDERRRAVGLQTLAEYYAELEDACAVEG